MKHRAVVVALLALVACSKPTDPGGPSPNQSWLTRQVGAVSYTYTDADDALVTTIAPVVASEAIRVTEFLGLSLARPYGVTISPDRVTFDDRFRISFGSLPACWVIATASAAGVELLSPRAWQCGHDSSSFEHLRLVLAHELVHVVHSQQLEPGNRLSMPWLAEGLAVYASGQIDTEYRGQAQARFSQGFVPASLAAIMNDSAAYGLAGDLVRYIDRVWGRATLRLLTQARSTAAAMAILNESETSLIERWRVNAGF